MAELLDKLSFSNDQKKLFNKTKHDFESYREIILIINSIIKWEKKFYPAIIFGVATIFYSFLWYLDLSMLTLISLGLLMLNLLDYTFPVISKLIFKPNSWNGVQEKKFEEVCREIVQIKMHIMSVYHYAKEEKSAMCNIIMITSLVVSAWIGATIDNLFLSYLITLLTLFYPGLSHTGIIKDVEAKIMEIGGPIFKNLMPKKDEKED